MSVLRLYTTASSPVWSATIPLEGVEYRFRYEWSDRSAQWMLELQNQSGDLIAASIAIVVAPPSVPFGVEYKGLIQRFQANGNVPPGRLFAIDMSGMGREIEVPGDLGRRVKMIYVTSDEF